MTIILCWLLVYTFLKEERIVLIDTDAGLDDTLAIMMAVRAQKDPKIPIKIVGITCVFGNTTLDNVTVNVTKVLQTVDATDVSGR